MNIRRYIQLFLSLAVGLLALAFIVALTAAQGPDQEHAPLDLPELRAEVLEHQASPAGRELGDQRIEAAADVRPPGSFDVILLSEDFEWSDSRWYYDGLWHDVMGYLDIPAHPYARNHSPAYSVWYGQDGTGNYDTGAVTLGAMTLRQAISIPTSAISVTVSFWSWEETEQTGSTAPGSCAPPPALCWRDFRGLGISGTADTTWQPLWNTWFTPTVEQQWHQVVADISAYRGQAVYLRFFFNSLTTAFNDNEGWYVDDIAVVAHGVSVPGYSLTDSWVQSFYEDYPNSTPDEEVYLDGVEASGVISWQVTNDGDEQGSAAVAAHPESNMPIVWTHSYTNTHDMPVGDVEYTALNRDGSTNVPLTKVTDNSGVTFPPIEDYGPAVAVNPQDGSTVIAWTHCLSCPVSYMTSVYDVHYAIRDASGGVMTGPVALSNNTDNDMQDRNPAVEAFPDGNVLIAWRHRDYIAPQHDVFYTIVDRNGNTIKAIDNLSGSPDTPSDIRLARLADGNILIAWTEDYLDIFHAVMDSSGSVVKAPTNLTNYGSSGIAGWYPEAVGLANGNSIIAWTELTEDWTVAQIKYAVLGGTYNVVKPPVTLANPYNATANGYVSMVTDEADAAILTWTTISYPSIQIYYARLDNQGNVLTEPTIYRQTRGSVIVPSSTGYGIGEASSPPGVYLPIIQSDH